MIKTTRTNVIDIYASFFCSQWSPTISALYPFYIVSWAANAFLVVLHCFWVFHDGQRKFHMQVSGERDDYGRCLVPSTVCAAAESAPGETWPQASSS